MAVSGSNARAAPGGWSSRQRRRWAFFTGFFGVGGGFLVVPALALVMGMSMYRATATALLVITLNSAVALVPEPVKPSISPPLSSSPRSC